MDLALVYGFDERVRVGEVGVWVTAVEIGRGNAVLGAGGWEAEFVLEDCFSVGACDTVESVEEDFEVCVGLEEFLDQGEIEDIFQHFDVV